MGLHPLRRSARTARASGRRRPLSSCSPLRARCLWPSAICAKVRHRRRSFASRCIRRLTRPSLPGMRSLQARNWRCRRMVGGWRSLRRLTANGRRSGFERSTRPPRDRCQARTTRPFHSGRRIAAWLRSSLEANCSKSICPVAHHSGSAMRAQPAVARGTAMMSSCSRAKSAMD